MTYTIADLARDCEVSEADAAAFVECLRVWTAKGWNIEAAIRRHMAQMTRLAEKSAELSRDPEIKAAVVDMFYPHWREPRGMVSEGR